MCWYNKLTLLVVTYRFRAGVWIYHSGLYASGSWAVFLLSSLKVKMIDYVTCKESLRTIVVPEMNKSPLEHSSWIENRVIQLEPWAEVQVCHEYRWCDNCLIPRECEWNLCKVRRIQHYVTVILPLMSHVHSLHVGYLLINIFLLIQVQLSY